MQLGDAICVSELWSGRAFLHICSVDCRVAVIWIVSVVARQQTAPECHVAQCGWLDLLQVQSLSENAAVQKAAEESQHNDISGRKGGRGSSTYKEYLSGWHCTLSTFILDSFLSTGKQHTNLRKFFTYYRKIDFQRATWATESCNSDSQSNLPMTMDFSHATAVISRI